VDLHAPWRLSADVLRAVHVGRFAELEALVEAGRRHAAGQPVLPVYLFGPRGVGKSHLLAVAWDRLGRESGLRVRYLPEDLPELRAPDALYRRMCAEAGGWSRGSGPAEGRRVALVDGLDRSLRALGRDGRRRLRALLTDDPDLLVMGAGTTLVSELVEADEAFFGAFDPWPVEELGWQDSLDLLSRVVDPAPGRARRRGFVHLAGGNPRALVAMAQVWRAEPTTWTARTLDGVMERLTGHYQQRLRALSPQAQELIHLLALSPREVAPGEVGATLGWSSAQTSTQARRLEAAGLLEVRSEGRRAWYSVREPLFRYWLEYRSEPPGSSRLTWTCDLLQDLCSLGELDELWLDGGDPDLSTAAARVVLTAGSTFLGRFRSADPTERERLLCRWAEVPATNDEDLIRTARGVFLIDAQACARLVGDGVDPATDRQDPIGAAARFLLDAANNGAARSAMSRLLDELGQYAEAPRGSADARRLWLLGPALAVIWREADLGPPWRLSGDERAALARIPWLRCRHLVHGRREVHEPWLEEADLLGGRLDGALDWRQLLVAASCVGAGELARVVLRGVAPADLETQSWVPRCPRPGHPLRPAASQFADALQPPALAWGDWVGWAATLVHARQQAWDSLLARLRAAEPSASRFVRPEGFPGLVAAWLQAPARAAELTEALRPVWGDWADRVPEAADSLAQGERGRLYDELGFLAQRLDPARYRVGLL